MMFSTGQSYAEATRAVRSRTKLLFLGSFSAGPSITTVGMAHHLDATRRIQQTQVRRHVELLRL